MPLTRLTAAILRLLHSVKWWNTRGRTSNAGTNKPTASTAISFNATGTSTSRCQVTPLENVDDKLRVERLIWHAAVMREDHARANQAMTEINALLDKRLIFTITAKLKEQP